MTDAVLVQILHNPWLLRPHGIALGHIFPRKVSSVSLYLSQVKRHQAWRDSFAVSECCHGKQGTILRESLGFIISSDLLVERYIIVMNSYTCKLKNWVQHSG